MYWQEDEDQEQFQIPDLIQDLAFSIRCNMLPVDHATALHDEITTLLPWLLQEPLAGIHQIHVADSGNGWERPVDAQEMLYLSRRTKLILRLPKERVDDAQILSGQSMVLAGQEMQVLEATPRSLSSASTLYARYVVTDPAHTEEEFVAATVQELRSAGLRFKKVLCGKQNDVAGGECVLHTRSLVISGLSQEDSVRLQEIGLGAHRLYGCGLFIPHKRV